MNMRNECFGPNPGMCVYCMCVYACACVCVWVLHIKWNINFVLHLFDLTQPIHDFSITYKLQTHIDTTGASHLVLYIIVLTYELKFNPT